VDNFGTLWCKKGQYLSRFEFVKVASVGLTNLLVQRHPIVVLYGHVSALQILAPLRGKQYQFDTILTLLWLITEVYRRMVGGKDVLDAGGKDALDRFATTFDCVQPTALT